MPCAPCTSLLEPVADCLPTSSSDTRQLSLLSGNPTPARSCENEPQKDGSPACECGKGTSGCSIHPNTPEAWTASMRASLARILALPENRQALERKRAVASTVKSSASLAWFDPATCSLKTSQQSLLTDSEPCSPTLPRSGMSRNGYVYVLPTVGRTITGTDGGYWPTPVKSDCVARRPSTNWEGSDLPSVVWRRNGGEQNPHKPPAKLNADWVDWLMGFPIGWTGLNAAATHKSRSKPQPLGDCSGAND